MIVLFFIEGCPSTLVVLGLSIIKELVICWNGNFSLKFAVADFTTRWRFYASTNKCLFFGLVFVWFLHINHL